MKSEEAISLVLGVARGLAHIHEQCSSHGSVKSSNVLLDKNEISCWMFSSERQVCRLRLAYLRAVLNQDMEAFDTDLSTGRIITGITNHMSVIQDAIGDRMGHFISRFARFFGAMIVAFVSCWEVALLALLMVPLILTVGATYSMNMKTIFIMHLAYLSEATSIVEQALSQIKTVFSFVGESSEIKSFSHCMKKQFELSKKEAFIKGLGLGMFQMVTFGSWALAIYVGTLVVTAKRSTGGDTMAALLSIFYGAISITYAAPDFQIFNLAKAAGKDVFKVIGRKPGISFETKGKTVDKIVGKIELRNVHFSYPSREDKLVLEGLSLSIPEGKVVALVGSSGCGKSTILSLVQRFYDPTTGDVLIDGHNIKNLDLRSLRRNIAAVSQVPSLFSGTIEDNLKVGSLFARKEQIVKAALTANAHSFISQLPNQYLTEVGERGVQLSGGQKQRIAIARAILKDPPILLLDEATSALDSESEKIVQDATERAMQGRTVILIAHRMSTVINSDIIIVVENGRIAQTGTHLKLLESNNFYSSIYSMQNQHTTTTDSNKESRDSENMLQGKEAIDDLPKAFKHHEEPKGLQKKLSHHIKKGVQKINTRSVPFFRIWFGLKKLEFAKIALGSFAAAFSGISQPLFGFFISTIGVAYYHHGSRRELWGYSIMFTLVGLVSLISLTIQHYFYGVVGETATRNLREALFSVVLRNEIAWFEKTENSVGFITSSIVNDTSLIKTVLADRMSVIVQCISSILIATVVSIILNWRMGLVAWAVMPCHFIAALIHAKSAKGFSDDSAIAHKEMVTLVSESASNIRTVASFVQEEQIIRKAEISLRKPLRASRIESVKYGIIQGVSLSSVNIANAVALWYTTVLIERNQASFVNALRSYQIFALTVPSITQLWTLIPTVFSTIRILMPAFQILDRETEIVPDVPDTSNQEKVEGRIEFKKILFNYPSRPEVAILNNFSLKIEAGLRVALVGPSGAGKSSVLALLLRFYNPCSGRILIDGKDIRQYNLRELRKQIGLVQQDPLPFNSSIRNNICYGHEGAAEAEIVEASIEANIHEFISNLPNGYDTVVGENGCQLSGSQKQRIVIARAILKRPTVLLLDEATSALDGESEKAVIDALGKQRFQKKGAELVKTTQITVAHRLSTVINSDNIVVMDMGKVVEIGSHSTLIRASDGLYSKLFHFQS